MLINHWNKKWEKSKLKLVHIIKYKAMQKILKIRNEEWYERMTMYF